MDGDGRGAQPFWRAPFIVLDAWNRLRRRLFVKALFTVAFSTEQKEEWKAIIEELKGHVVRTGKLNFSLKGNPRSLKAISVTPYKVVGKLGYENKTTPKLSAPFLESNLVLDPSNATREIEKMVTTCESLPPGERALFLNLKMKSVPVPSKGSDLWSEIGDVTGCLEALGKLAVSFHNARIEERSNEQEAQTIVNLYTLYAIMEKIAPLEGGTINPWNLVLWVQQPKCRILDGEVHIRIKELYRYFGLGDPVTTTYTQDDIAKLSQNCLFYSDDSFLPSSGLIENQYQGRRDLLIDLAHKSDNPKEYEYYVKLLKDPQIIRRLEQEFGLPPSAPMQEKLAVLMTNSPSDSPQYVPNGLKAIAEGWSKYEEESNEAKNLGRALVKAVDLVEELRQPPEKKTYKGLLPFPFHLLRLTHFMCKQRILHYTRTQALNDLGNLDIYESPFSIEKRGSGVRELINIFSFGILCKGPIDRLSPFRHFFGAYMHLKGTGLSFTHEKEFKAAPGSFESFSFVNGDDNRIKEFYLVHFHEYLTRPRKEQHEVLNADNPLNSKAFEWWGRWKESIFGGQSFEFGGMKPYTKKMGEMCLIDPKDQPVRVLSLFQENLDALKKPDVRAFFELFLFHRNLLMEQVKTCPSFLDQVFQFFSENIEYLVKDKQFVAALDLFRMAIYIHLQGETSGYKSSFDLKGLVRLFAGVKDKPHLYAYLIPLYYSLKDPRSMSVEERGDVIEELLVADALDSRSNKVKDEVWSRWKPWMQKTIDDVPRLRNRLMNRLAEVEGFKRKGSGRELIPSIAWVPIPSMFPNGLASPI